MHVCLSCGDATNSAHPVHRPVPTGHVVVGYICSICTVQMPVCHVCGQVMADHSMCPTKFATKVRMASTIEKYRAGQTISLDELKRRVLRG